MTSDKTTTLVVGLTLGLTLLLVLALAFCFVVHRRRFFPSKAHVSFLEHNLASYTEAGKKVVSQLGTYKLSSLKDASPHYEVQCILLRFMDDSPTECPDTVDRIEKALFQNMPRGHLVTEDFTIFPNPHHYTAAEIFNYLQNPYSRQEIATHIVLSVLERYTSLSPSRTIAESSLLPFKCPDIIDLYNLRSRLHGVEWSGKLRAHIDEYPNENRIHQDPGNPKRQFLRNYFEELFGPYFQKDSPEKDTHRKHRMEELLDSAVEFGYIAACLNHKIEYVWGEKQEHYIRLIPKLQMLMYEGGKKYTHPLNDGAIYFIPESVRTKEVV
ncbi:hypothetical protein BJ875DRAFT_525303 [Amylocarpus encephaloides]|uniref:Uncharacterized protein n=1 Tax=Amylocarpus encephaloides TaxID=45428 RepID=A0A9P7YMX3_9HELO|nr:hypothetical protein BJ875DRAFT_525303 [Amylocarpus encephaloides]